MRLTARAGLAAALGALILLWGGAASGGGMVVRQVSNGFAGQDADQGLTLQDMYVGENALRIEEVSPSESIAPTNSATAVGVTSGAFPSGLSVSATAKPVRPSDRYTVVRLDKKVIWEFDRRLQEYTELNFDYLRNEREKADADREDHRKVIIKKFSGAERAKELAAQHLREDGKREVTSEDLPGELMYVAGKPYHTRQTAVFVNGDRLLDIFTTDEIQFQQPKALLDFYENSGLFEADVAKKLSEIKGFPLVTWVKIDLEGRLQATIESRALSVNNWPEQASRFEIPPGFEKKNKFTSIEPGAEKNIVTCEFCKLQIPIAKAFTPNGPDHRKLWFCSSDHWNKYEDQLGNQGK